MNATCKSCRAPVTWKLNAQNIPEPYDADGRSHWQTCPDAERFRGDAAFERLEAFWGNAEARHDEQQVLVREALAREHRESGVQACRDRPRDAQHGDKWCRSCYQPRPAGHECAAANWGDSKKGTVVRYVKDGDEVRPLRGAALKEYLKGVGR